MDEKQSNQFIRYAVMAIVAYYILQFIVPYLIYGVIGMVVWRVYQAHQKTK